MNLESTESEPALPPEPAAVFSGRRRRALAALRKTLGEEVHAVLVTSPANLRYFAGATEGANALLFGGGPSLAFTGRMFEVRVGKEARGCRVRIPKQALWPEIAAILEKRGLRTLVFEDAAMPVKTFRQLEKAGQGLRLVGAGDVLTRLRFRKNAREIALTRRAVEIAETALRELLAPGAAAVLGRSEKEIAAELDYRVRRRGADDVAFRTIVASGPNTYFCHHVPGDRKVRTGDALLFDWGAELDGYRSDITRTFFIGNPPGELEKIYRLVLEAHDAAVRAVRIGVHMNSLDRIARGIIRRAGYAREFRHGLGHGFGLEIHEPVGLPAAGSTGNPQTLCRNSLVTIEPGVYVLGLGGVRIEDDVLVSPAGGERLNRLPRDFDSAILR